MLRAAAAADHACASLILASRAAVASGRPGVIIVAAGRRHGGRFHAIGTHSL